MAVEEHCSHHLHEGGIVSVGQKFSLDSFTRFLFQTQRRWSTTRSQYVIETVNIASIESAGWFLRPMHDFRRPHDLVWIDTWINEEDLSHPHTIETILAVAGGTFITYTCPIISKWSLRKWIISNGIIRIRWVRIAFESHRHPPRLIRPSSMSRVFPHPTGIVSDCSTCSVSMAMSLEYVLSIIASDGSSSFSLLD